MNRRWALTLLVAALVIGVIGLLGLWRAKSSPPPLGTANQPGDEATVSGPSLAATLYFPGGDRLLVPESREIPLRGSVELQVRSLVQELLAGPRGDGMAAPLPAGTQLSGVYLGADRVVYLDLRGEEGAPPPQSGSRQEMLRVYSLVNSVALNVPGVERVALLWNGQQLSSWAGHLDLSVPQQPNRNLVAGSP
jgi:hypothetical protein